MLCKLTDNFLPNFYDIFFILCYFYLDKDYIIINYMIFVYLEWIYMNLMIVDDSPAMRKMIIRDLVEIRNREDDNYFEAEDGLEAIKVLNTNKVDIVFVDWNMPRLDGLAFVQNIRSKENMKELIIIMITHENKQEKIMEAIKAGVDAYIVKPFTIDMLWKKINEFIG